jgi:hypothetical protein
MSIKLQAEYGEDLQVLFVEVQGADDDKVVEFALGQKWLGGRAMWTTERPFNLGLDGIPQFGLIAPDGEMVLSGYTNENSSKIEGAIAEMVKDARKPSKDLPKDVAKALVEANKGGYAKALGMLADLLADPKAEADHEAAGSVKASIESRIDKSVARVGWMLDNGYPVEAEALHAELAKGLKGAEHAAEALAGLGERLATDAVKAEIAAQKAFTKIAEKLYEEGPNEKAKKSLVKLAEKYAGTKVAARASELAKVAG